MGRAQLFKDNTNAIFFHKFRSFSHVRSKVPFCRHAPPLPIHIPTCEPRGTAATIFILHMNASQLEKLPN